MLSDSVKQLFRADGIDSEQINKIDDDNKEYLNVKDIKLFNIELNNGKLIQEKVKESIPDKIPKLRFFIAFNIFNIAVNFPAITKIKMPNDDESFFVRYYKEDFYLGSYKELKKKGIRIYYANTSYVRDHLFVKDN